MKYFHRFNIVIILIISATWACFSFKVNPYHLINTFQFIELLKITYILAFTVVFWAIFYLEICDLICTALGKNGRLYSKYFLTIRKELAVTFISAVILMSIYWGDSVDYELSGIDIGFVGIPFIIGAAISVFQTMKIKIAGEPVRRTMLFITLMIIFIFFYISYSSLRKNSSGEYENYQALWFQLTILFTSFWFYLSANWQLYFLSGGKIEVSNFKRYFMNEISWVKSNISEDADKMTREFNKINSIKRARYSSGKRRKK